MITRIDNITICGEIDDGALSQIIECARHHYKAVLCADHHKGYSVPIGGVLAHPTDFSIASVGYDIACGMKAVKLDLKADDIRGNMSKIMDDIFSQISFGVGLKNKKTVDHPLFDDDTWTLSSLKNIKDLAREQLGTIGSGNHWVNVFEDEEGEVWIGCHFGSRGLGHKATTWYLDAGGFSDQTDGPPPMLSSLTQFGQEYLKVIDLAGEYAYAGRNWVCDTVASIIGASQLEEVHLHHNHIWLEEIDGQQMYVGRKGATPAAPGQRGLVGASMAEPCAIIEGVESDLNKELLNSTVHGAGRVMSRVKAKGKFNKKTGEVKQAPLVTPEMMFSKVREAGVELRGGDVDESPHVYKRLPEVLAHHEDSIKVVHWLKPLGVAMAPKGLVDPYKD